MEESEEEEEPEPEIIVVKKKKSKPKPKPKVVYYDSGSEEEPEVIRRPVKELPARRRRPEPEELPVQVIDYAKLFSMK